MSIEVANHRYTGEQGKMSRERWNELVRGAAIRADDEIPHTACNWKLCSKEEGHEGKCETIRASIAHGEVAFKWGMGPCWECREI